MRKKSTILIMVVLMFISTNIYGADLVYRLTHGDQYALILGTVEQVNENWIKVKVERSLNGKDVGEKIKIYANERRKIEPKFYWYEPEEGDYIVVSIDKDLFRYKLKWGVFKVSSLNYMTLSIEKGGLSSPDNAMFQYYINSGCKENSFYFDNGKVFVRKSDGSEVEIFPKVLDSIENNIDYNGNMDNIETLSLMIENMGISVLVIALSITTLALLLFFTLKRKHNSR